MEDTAVRDRRRLIWGIVALLIAGGTIWTVFSSSGKLSPAALLARLHGASPGYLALSLLCMAGYIVFEALALYCILRGLGYRVGPRSLFYSAGDQFFSAITPSATGGQPASALFMAASGIPGAVITVTLLLNLMLYTVATLTIGAVCLAVRFPLFLRFGLLSRFLILGGMAVLVLLVALFFGLLRHGAMLERLGRKLFSLLTRLRLMRHPDHWNGRLEKLVREHKLCARTVAGNARLLWAVYLLNLAQRASQISVIPLLFRAVGGVDGFDADLWVVQALSQIGSSWVPIPGGMGAADYLMLDGFQFLFSRDFAYELEILGRGISFYVCTLVSGLIVLIGYWILSRRRRGKKADGGPGCPDNS